MDPAQNQSDKSNDANSLEGTGTIIETAAEGAGQSSDAKHTNTSAGPEADKPQTPPKAKQSFFKRIWQKFNIYLLFFVLIILIGVGITVIMFYKNRNDNKKAESVINSQNLSDSALKQLANSDVTVGNAKQVLKVESNAVFAGSVLIRNNLEVAGTIKVGGELQLPGITVSGSSRFNQLQADNLIIGSDAMVQGAFTVKKGLSVSGSSTFDGPVSAAQITTSSLQLNGELKLTNHIVAGGPVPSLSRGAAVGSGGTASLSGSDTTGSIIVNTGSNPGAGCFATVAFVRRFDGTPHVNITPIGSGAATVQYYVNRSSSEFSICTVNPAPAGQTFGFDYMILN